MPRQVWTNATGWQRISGCSVTPMLTDDAVVSKRDCHGWLFGWKDGAVFQARTLQHATQMAEREHLHWLLNS